jgi:hypothetical protein
MRTAALMPLRSFGNREDGIKVLILSNYPSEVSLLFGGAFVTIDLTSGVSENAND